MCKYILYIFLLLTNISLIAQDVVGYVISENGSEVPFASIYLKEKNIGIVADINGNYKLTVEILSETNDTLIFSSIGYESLIIPVSLFKEKVSEGNTNIQLSTNHISLPEVVIMPDTSKPKEYGMFSFRSSNFIVTGKPSTRIMVFVENSDKANRIIQTVNIRIQKNNDETKKLRVFFYQKTKDGFQNINVAEEDICITDFSSSRIRLDVSKYHIPFPEKGIYVGVEWIGELNTVQKRSKEIGLSLRTTASSNISHTWVFDNETWVKFPAGVISDEEINELPRNFRRTVYDSNVQIGITAY
jgi:hypothetical protein